MRLIFLLLGLLNNHVLLKVFCFLLVLRGKNLRKIDLFRNTFVLLELLPQLNKLEVVVLKFVLFILLRPLALYLIKLRLFELIFHFLLGLLMRLDSVDKDAVIPTHKRNTFLALIKLVSVWRVGDALWSNLHEKLAHGEVVIALIAGLLVYELLG
jgi:hypothetical protein